MIDVSFSGERRDGPEDTEGKWRPRCEDHPCCCSPHCEAGLDRHDTETQGECEKTEDTSSLIFFSAQTLVSMSVMLP